MLTSFEDFFKKQGPWAIVLEILAVLIIVVIVGLTIVTLLGTSPRSPTTPAPWRTGWRPAVRWCRRPRRLLNRWPSSSRRNCRKVTMFEGWPQNIGTMPSFPGGWQFVYPIPFGAGK